MFLDLVERLTAKPLAADDWVHDLERPLEAVVGAAGGGRGAGGGGL